MNNSYVEVTIPDGMLDYMEKVQLEVYNFLMKPKSEYEKIYTNRRSLWMLFMVEYKTCIGVAIPEHLTEWVSTLYYTEEYWCVDGTQLYNSLRDLIWLFRLNNKALLNQLHAAHFKQILDKLIGDDK